MKFKQRRHVLGKGKNPIDIYPEIDEHIPEAVSIANLEFPGADGKRAEPGLRSEWSKCFMDEMDKLLKKRGLRV